MTKIRVDIQQAFEWFSKSGWWSSFSENLAKVIRAEFLKREAPSRLLPEVQVNDTVYYTLYTDDETWLRLAASQSEANRSLASMLATHGRVLSQEIKKFQDDTSSEPASEQARVLAGWLEWWYRQEDATRWELDFEKIDGEYNDYGSIIEETDISDRVWNQLQYLENGEYKIMIVEV